MNQSVDFISSILLDIGMREKSAIKKRDESSIAQIRKEVWELMTWR